MKYSAGSKCLSEKETSTVHFSWRVVFLFIFFLFILGAVFFRLYFLQVISFEAYKALAEGQHTLFEKLIPIRGEVFLKNKNEIFPAAVNKNTKMAYAVPREIEDSEKASKEISEIIKIDENYLKDKFSNREDGYEPLKHRLSDEEMLKLENLEIKGLHLINEVYRYYPSGELASNVLGFVGWRENEFGGRYGIEAYFDKILRGEEGNIIHGRDAAGRKIFSKSNEIKKAINGDSLVLTIDYTAQYMTEKILESAIEKFRAESGSVIVMEPDTGRILAMAVYPTFNPNEYSREEDINVFRNTAVSDPYESGSVFKTFTIAAGIDSGKISSNAVYVDTGAVDEVGYVIRNSDLKSNGKQTMTQVLEKSLNTGAIFVEKLIGNKNFYDYMKRFGFGEPTGIDLIGESAGNINNLKNLKSDIQFFTASFGQGITITPIQLITAYGAIANGGVLMKPQIVDKIIRGDGSEEKIKPEEARRVISERAALETGRILISVVKNGHGKRAGVPGYLVAGKTGTAQVASEERRGYEEGKKTGSFAGFAPANNPKFAILVKIDNPQNVEWAESSAAPAFGELMKFLLEYYNIEPTEEYIQADLDKFNATHNLNKLFVKKEEKQEEENKQNENE